jgi:capsular polysaccharide biosynthesis protein
MIRQLVLGIKVLRHRFLIRTRFSQPSTLSPECVRLRVIAQEKLALPCEFLTHSRSYRSQPVPEFASEDVHACTFDREISVHDARLVRLGGNHYLDAGNQNHEPWQIIGKSVAAKPTEPRATLIVPWGHGGASYGDFIIKVLPKLTRLWDAVPENERQELGVCLPYFHTQPWALEYLALMGIRKNQILDGSSTILVPPGGRLVVGSGPNPGHGMAHPHDIRSMIGRLQATIPSPSHAPWRRLYISRKTGRKMSNETALLAGLAARNFEMIHLENLSLHEQITLFQEAAVVVGPHGAGHANIIWSSPGIRLLEVFHPAWMHPCYALLSQILGIHYHCLVGHDGSSRGSWTEKSRYGIFEDPSIDPEILFRTIDSITSP